MIIIGESALELKSGKYIFEADSEISLKKNNFINKEGMLSIFYPKMHQQ